MFTLENDSLAVSILDPEADQERFGTRYCTGGYIFQITDAKHGELLSGPTFPESFDTYNGQGIPDAFNKTPLRDKGDDAPDSLVIGIGMCDLSADTITEFCSWNIEEQVSSVTMTTTQARGNFSLELDRTVSLVGRTVRSHSRLNNTGKRPIPVNWFPHPFYPQLPDNDELCKFGIPVSFPENKGFELRENGFISRKDWPWVNGYYQALNHDAHSHLTVLQKHPKLGLVAATCSYTPCFFPIWGNPHTFSWEPFYERTVAAGQSTQWWIDYEF